MRVVHRMFVASAVLSVAAVSVQGQTCRGFASLDKSHMNVGADAWFPTGSTPVGADFHMRHDGMGMEHVVSLGIGTTAYSGSGASSSLDLDAGLGFEKTAKSGLEWCPDLMIAYQTNAAGFKDAHDLDLGASVGFGKDMGKMSGMDLVPFGTVGFVHSTYTASGFSGNGTHHFVYGVGLGFRMSNGIEVSPQINKTTTTGSDVVFGVTLSVPLGK